MWGITLAFKNYSPYLGFWASPWVGLEHFKIFLRDPYFLKLLGNTLTISVLSIVFNFPIPILLSLLLNEVKHEGYKKSIQTLVYIPHFISMVIIASIFYILFNTRTGPINNILQSVIGTKVEFLGSTTWFRPLIIIQSIWKETGWGTIIFLAALAGVDVEQYEAALVDGANRWQKLWYITLPALKSTVVVLLILRMGSVMNTGFEQIYLMKNALNAQVAEVFDTYTYTMGITQGSFSYSTAVGLFKSVIGLILIQSSNFFAKKYGDGGLF
jgi:putative aldouronate transport system permease protein